MSAAAEMARLRVVWGDAPFDHGEDDMFADMRVEAAGLTDDQLHTELADWRVDGLWRLALRVEADRRFVKP